MTGAVTDPWLISGVPVTLKRSARRRTVGLQVRPGQVTLHAPQAFPTARLDALLLEKRGWVEANLNRFAAQTPAPRPFLHGETVAFLGEQLTLHFSDSVRGPERRGQTLLLPRQDEPQHLETWTRASCLAPYRELVTGYARQLGAGAKLRHVRVSRARTRWGSCNSQGDIRLHWKLSRAPLGVLHYVALHEAAHLLELNHSPRYWAHVARIMPEWKQWRDWLRVNGHSL